MLQSAPPWAWVVFRLNPNGKYQIVPGGTEVMLRTATLLSAVILPVLATSHRAGAEWTESHKLTASDAASADFFGISVAVSGNTAVVGASTKRGHASFQGAVYLFDVDSGSELFKLTASEGGASDWLGHSVAISGNTAIAGAPFGIGASGSAYLFDVATGNELLKVTASDGAELDQFGFSVGISGNTAIVGAFGDDDAGNSSGSAYLFDVATGDQLFKLTALDGAPDHHFGQSVAISGNTAIVGALLDDHAGSASGSAYLFDVATGDQLFKLTASDTATDDLFGGSVAISGNTAIVGGFEDNGPGALWNSAYLFDVHTGSELQKLVPFQALADDRFRLSVAISGNTAIVGAHQTDEAGRDSGSAYVFVPEPASLWLLAIGVVALLTYGWRRRTI